ncbi:MAG: NADH-quinone oxidoreductase subunit N [Candidatus Thorarchaeota archaeon]|nr:NADH-quinone oxidoreductase subunit N [Candidatus Thorarchaeota archaeon]
MLQLDILLDSLRALLAPLRDLLLAIVPAEWIMSLPAITLVVFGLLALMVGLRYNPLVISFIGVILATFEMLLFDPSAMSGYSFGTLFIRDAFTDFFIYIVLIVAFLVLLSSTLWGGDKGTYNFLLLLSFAGALWVIMATDLVALFLAWELMSTPTYVLVALSPRRESVDGATKYFVMGLLATNLMLLGIALTIGVTGTTDLHTIGVFINSLWASPAGSEPAVYTMLLAMVLFIVSFGFKVGIFPGWQWVPDAYASADGSVTAYLAGGSKKTGVSALLRILMVAFFVARTEWTLLIAGVAILTMIIGNLLALAQKDIMRMLAYSSIAMMGYLFIGIAAANELGMAAASFHAFTHAIMKTAAFILVWMLSLRLTKRITYDDLAGLNKRAPIAAAMFAILMLSLAGLPVGVGFWSKLVLFQSAILADMWWLALIGLLNSVFSLGYYLRILKYTYMIEPVDDSKLNLPRVPLFAVGICVAIVLLLLVFPNLVLDYAFQAALTFFP